MQTIMYLMDIKGIDKTLLMLIPDEDTIWSLILLGCLIFLRYYKRFPKTIKGIIARKSCPLSLL